MFVVAPNSITGHDNDTNLHREHLLRQMRLHSLSGSASVIVRCHRVVGADCKPVGFGGGRRVQMKTAWPGGKIVIRARPGN